MSQERAWLAAFLVPLCTGAAGCVSSGTWSAWHKADRALASIEADAPEPASGEGEMRALAFASCDEAVGLAIATHPGLAAPRERARAALAMARAEGALPAPSASVRVWDFPIGDPSRADHEGMYMLGVAQELPPAGSLDGRARALVEEARAALGELAEMRREIGSGAAHACADWAAAAATRESLAAYLATLDQMREVVGARYAAPGSSLADVARVEREQASARRMLRRAEGEVARAEASLRARLGVSPTSTIGDPPALAREAPALDASALVDRAVAQRGLLLAARARIEAARARADAAEARATVPTFMFGGMYMQAPQARAGMSLEVGMTLPWLWSGERDALDAARAEARAEEAEVAGLERDVDVDVRTAIAALDALARTLAALREEEAPAATRALDAVVAMYRTGEGTLLDWLDAARAVRELAVTEVELLGDIARAVADVDAATGLVARASQEAER